MTNPYYNTGGYPAAHASGVSASLRQELANITAGFNLLPTLAGSPLYLVRVNAAANALESFVDPYLTAATAASTYLPKAGGTVSGNLGVGSGITAGFQVDVVGTVNVRDSRNLGTTLGAILYGGDAGTLPYVGSNYNSAFAIYTNANERMRIDASGHIGIGGASLGAHLEVNGGARIISTSVSSSGVGLELLWDGSQSIVQSYSRSGGTYQLMTITGSVMSLQTAGTERLRIDASGNVGIGATSAGAKLHVNGNFIQVLDANYAGYIGKGSALVAGGAISDFGIRTDSGAILFATATNVERMRITAGGSVGIGKTPTLGSLDVAGRIYATVGGTTDTITALSGASNSYAAVAVGRTAPEGFMGAVGTNSNFLTGTLVGDTVFLGTNNVWLGMQGAFGINLSTNGATRMSIDSSGNFGLGGISPSAFFHIKSPADETLRIQRDAGFISFYNTANTTRSGYFRIQTGGGELYVDLAQPLTFGTSGTARMQITAAGVIQDAAALELGFKGLPGASVTTGAFAASDRGKCVYATGGVTVPNATMVSGDVVVIQDTTGSASTITATITTLRKSGGTLTGNRTLAAWGRCSILFISNVLAVISGDVT